MKIEKSKIVFTKLEAISIAECLESLESMSGSLDPLFNKEAIKAGILSRKIRETVKNK